MQIEFDRSKKTNGQYLDYLVNGKSIRLFRRNTKINLEDLTEVEMLIANVENALSTGAPLDAFAARIGGNNLFRILDALFFDDALRRWCSHYTSISANSIPCFRTAFKSFFGFYHPITDNCTDLFSCIHSFSINMNQTQRDKAVVLSASSQNYRVDLIAVNNNSYEYSVNGVCVSICLRGKTGFRSANEFLSALLEYESALVSRDYSAIMKAIHNLGAAASLRIAYCLFRKHLTDFLFAFALSEAETKRKRLYPRNFLKHFFGSHITEHHLSVLDDLERLMPKVDKHLIENNKDEIRSDKDSWVLYEKNGEKVERFHIMFGNTPYAKEAKAYCLVVAQRYERAGNSYASHILKLAGDLLRVATCLENANLPPIESVLELTAFQTKALIIYFNLACNYSLKTQRRILYNIKQFYDYIQSKSKTYGTSFPCKIPNANRNPTKPLTNSTLLGVLDRLHSAPRVVELALLLCIILGARAKSICNLTVNDFVLEDDGIWYVKITLFKTLGQKQNSTIKRRINEALAKEVNAFIAETSALRQKLCTPYLFVYESDRRRENSLRVPSVLNPDSLYYYLQALTESNDFYDCEGNRVIPGPKVLRATLAHDLRANGITETETSRYLGNTPYISASHYNYLTPEEESLQKHKLYEAAIVPVLQDVPQLVKQKGHKVMFGRCNNASICNSRNCQSCMLLYTCSDTE